MANAIQHMTEQDKRSFIFNLYEYADMIEGKPFIRPALIRPSISYYLRFAANYIANQQIERGLYTCVTRFLLRAIRAFAIKGYGQRTTEI